MNKIKKNWKEILIGLLVIFCMNKCTVSCNRGSKLDKATKEIATKDSTIAAMSDSIKSLNVTVANLMDKNGMLADFNKKQSTSDSLNRAAQKEQMSTIKKMIKDHKSK